MRKKAVIDKEVVITYFGQQMSIFGICRWCSGLFLSVLRQNYEVASSHFIMASE